MMKKKTESESSAILGTKETAEDKFSGERAFLEKVNRILTGNTGMKVSFSDSARGGAEASIKGGDITLNPNSLPGWDYMEFLSSLKGLNYHELGHYLHTDYRKSDLLDTDRAKALSYLEDARVESLFSQSFPKAKKYFRAAGLNTIRPDPNSYLFTYGRRFLMPRKIISGLKSLFSTKYGDETRGKAEKIVDSFILEPDRPKRLALAGDLARLLNLEGDDSSPTIPIPSPGQNTGDTFTSYDGKPKDDGGQNEEARKGLKDKMDKEKQEQGGKGKDGGKAPEKAKNEPQKGGQGKEGEDKGNDGGNNENSGKPSEQQRQQPQPSQDDIKKQINDETKKSMEASMEQISGDLNDDLPTIRSLASGTAASLDGPSQSTDAAFHPSDTHQRISNRLKKLLSEMRIDLSSRYMNKKKSGRINPREFMRFKQNGSIDIFRKWKPSRVDDAKLATCIALDVSGSMSQHIGRPPSDGRMDWPRRIDAALGGAWCIYDALRKSRLGYMALITFSSYCKIRKRFTQKAVNWDIEATGGTAPAESFAESYRQFRQIKGKVKNQLMIVMTDGEWGYSEDACRILNGMARSGIEVLVIFIGEDYIMHEVVKNLDKKVKTMTITDIEELPKEMTRFIKDLEAGMKGRMIKEGKI